MKKALLLLLLGNFALLSLPSLQDVGIQIAKECPNKQAFLFGASTSEHQCSKRCTPEICTWSRFAQEHKLAQPTDEKYPINLWDNYKSYIDYAKDILGLNALRFSVEWALVQPQGPDAWDANALDHYADQFIYAIKKDVMPIICLHHYTDPCWFADRGGFEKISNSRYFVNYCTKIYSHIINRIEKDQQAKDALKKLNPRTPLWATFNSPEGYAFHGYREMNHPPARKDACGLNHALTVLKNMMESHVYVYYALNKKHRELQTSLPSPKIGFLKNIHQLDPSHKTLMHKLLLPISSFICGIGNTIQNRAIYSFFTKGKFKVYIPFSASVSHTNKRAIGALDFIGLNYYSNRFMALTKTIRDENPKRQTDNENYRIYPKGLYRAIEEISNKMAMPLSIPIYITENGIATQDETKRYHFYHAYMHALHHAIKDGYPVYGYLTWTLADNYEWPHLHTGSKRVYGLCTVDKKNPAQLQVKPGSQSYIEIIKSFFSYAVA